MTKLEALHWLAKYGAVTWGYPEEAAAAYLGLGVKHFRAGAQRYVANLGEGGPRPSYERDGGNVEDTSDPIMASMNAAKPSAVRTSRPR